MSTCGQVVRRIPATDETRVRFPASALFDSFLLTDFPSSYPFYFDIVHRPVRLYTFLRRPSVFSMCKMLMRPPTTMRPVPFRLLFLSQDAVLNTRWILLMTILNSTLYTTQHSCADSSFPLQYRAEQCTFPQIDAQTRHFDAILRCHDFSFRLTLATLSC